MGYPVPKGFVGSNPTPRTFRHGLFSFPEDFVSVEVAYILESGFNKFAGFLLSVGYFSYVFVSAEIYELGVDKRIPSGSDRGIGGSPFRRSSRLISSG